MALGSAHSTRLSDVGADSQSGPIPAAATAWQPLHGGRRFFGRIAAALAVSVVSVVSLLISFTLCLSLYLSLFHQ
jgi:hypothetical protein